MKIDFTKKAVPVAPLMGFPGAHLTSTTIKENLEDSNVQFKSLNSLYERFQPDAMITMMDLTVEAEALGLEVLKPDDDSYTIVQHPIQTEADIEKLTVPDPYKDGRMPLFIDVVKKMKDNFECENIAYIIGPFTLAGLLNSADRIIRNVLKKPDLIKKMLEFTVEVNKKYANALIEAGADTICILEPTATLLSPRLFDKFSGMYVESIAKELDVPVILHICGNTTPLIKNMISTGVDALSLDSMVKFAEINDMVPDEVILIGNVDPVKLIAYGEKDEVEKEIKDLLDSMKERNSFILSTGCDLPKDTKLENIELMFKVAQEV